MAALLMGLPLIRQSQGHSWAPKGPWPLPSCSLSADRLPIAPGPWLPLRLKAETGDSLIRLDSNIGHPRSRLLLDPVRRGRGCGRGGACWPHLGRPGRAGPGGRDPRPPSDEAMGRAYPEQVLKGAHHSHDQLHLLTDLTSPHPGALSCS